MEDNIIVIDDLGLSNTEVLNVKQLQILFKKTPENHIYTRPGKGGGTWNYVTGTYVKKVLNLMFNFDWDFEVQKFEYNMKAKQCIILGKLTVRTNGITIVKNQFGRADMKFKTEKRKDNDGHFIMNGKYPKKFPTDIPLDLGNDLKAAATDALKKCASELGIAADVYSPNEFKSIKVVEKTKEEIEIDRQYDNIRNHINNSTTQEQLRQCLSSIGDDEELLELYNNKFDKIGI